MNAAISSRSNLLLMCNDSLKDCDDDIKLSLPGSRILEAQAYLFKILNNNIFSLN